VLKVVMLSVGLGLVVYGTFSRMWILTGLGALVICSSVFVDRK
jgi:hypothetical protein